MVADGSIAATVEAARELTLVERNAKLLRDNKLLAEHLELAVANIMRLTLGNRQPRRELEAAAKVTTLDVVSRQRPEREC